MPLECPPLPERSLIDELDLITIPVTRWSPDEVVDVDPDTRWTVSVTVSLSLTASASVTVSWSW